MRSTAAVAGLAVWLALGLARADGDFEPEVGLFGDWGPSDPYLVALRDALIGKDAYRQCELVIKPSWTQEAAVYIVPQPDLGTYGPAGGGQGGIVISRTFKKPLSKDLDELIYGTKPHTIPSIAEAEAAALAKIKIDVETRTAELDEPAVKVLDAACRAVLLRVRYPTHPVGVLDGTSYHASHHTRMDVWVTLAGQTQSPAAGTVADEFVRLERVLKSYAEAPVEKRAGIRAELLEKAQALSKRLRSAP